MEWIVSHLVHNKSNMLSIVFYSMSRYNDVIQDEDDKDQVGLKKQHLSCIGMLPEY